MVTRSKAAWAAKKKRVSDTTYQGIINFHEGMEERLHQTLEHYGQLKAVDLSRAQAHYNEHQTLPTREERVLPIREQKVSSDIARAIVEHNTTLIENTVEAAEKNTRKWSLERDKAPVSRKHKYQRKIDRAKRVSICLGSKTLFKRAQKDATGVLMSEWRDRRLFFECSGESGRIGGNRQARLAHVRDDIFSLTMPLFDVENGSYSWVEVGLVRYKRGTQAIRSAVDARTPVSMRISKKGRHYTVYSTLSVDPFVHREFTPKGTHHVGFDLNNHHYDFTIVDRTANPLGRATVNFGNATQDMDSKVAETFQGLYERGVGSVSIERLNGINRAKSARETGHKSAQVRKIVNQLPVRLFLAAVKRNARKYGMELSLVSAAYTSKKTDLWSALKFGEDSHQKASYLIARRGLGYPLKRRPKPTVSGRQRMSTTAGRNNETNKPTGVPVVMGHAPLMGEAGNVTPDG